MRSSERLPETIPASVTVSHSSGAQPNKAAYHWVLIAAIAWIAHYLHFASFGLYEDDWFLDGFPFLVTPKEWMFTSLLGQFKATRFEGRPLQYFFEYSFGEAGALAKNIGIDYLIAYALFTAAAILMYEVLRQRFSPFVALLSTILFILTPLHTLHQFLGQFSVAPAFIFVFVAILLYLRNKRIWACVCALAALFCYESVFFLFLGAPLMRKGAILRGRRREWITHLGVFAIFTGMYLVARKLAGETRVGGLPGGFSMVAAIIYACLFDTVTSFATYIYAALRLHEASIEAWLYAGLFLVLIALTIFAPYERKASESARSRRTPIRELASPALLGLVFLVLGYATAYFFFLESPPHFHVTDRETRISIAASVGSSIFVASFFAAWIAFVRSRTARLIAYTCTGGFLLVMFLYSFVLQQDYVDDWQEQRTDAAQVMALTPDVQRDSMIVLRLHPLGLPILTSGRRRRAIGLEKTLYEWEFQNVYAIGQPWPRLYFVYSDDWPKHLKLGRDGYMRFDAPTFDGRWFPPAGEVRCRPGKFIVLDEVEPGWIIRHSEPITVAGQQIVQAAPAETHRAPLWASLRQSALTRIFLPDSAWKSPYPQAAELGSGVPLNGPMVTFTWPANPDAVDYWIDIGTAPGKGDIFGGFTKGKNEMTVTLAGHLTGETIYVQLYAKRPNKELAVGSGAKYQFPTIHP